MKKNTYPVAENKQAEEFRKIFKDDTQPGRVKGINNSWSLKSLFPQSPFYSGHTVANSVNTDRGKFFENINTTLTSSLTNDIISDMFAYVIDGSQTKSQLDVPQPHVQNEGADGNNYNWLYRDQPMDMNFNYLKANASGAFEKSSPDADTAPVGSNSPINNPDLVDQPFWGHANIQVPSIDPFAQRQVSVIGDIKLPQLIRGTGGFGTNYPVSNRPFASQEKIGQYFSNVYANDEQSGNEGQEIDRMTYIAGKSIISNDNQPTSGNSAYQGDIDNSGVKLSDILPGSKINLNLPPTFPRS